MGKSPLYTLHAVVKPVLNGILIFFFEQMLSFHVLVMGQLTC